jgi:hypothetical protein
MRDEMKIGLEKMACNLCGARLKAEGAAGGLTIAGDVRALEPS